MNEVRAGLTDLAWTQASPGLRAKAAARDGKLLRLVEIDPGIEHDWCLTGHVGYVLEGTLELELDSQTLTLGSGDGFIIKPGEAERHKPRAIGSTVRLVLVEDTQTG